MSRTTRWLIAVAVATMAALLTVAGASSASAQSPRGQLVAGVHAASPSPYPPNPSTSPYPPNPSSTSTQTGSVTGGGTGGGGSPSNSGHGLSSTGFATLGAVVIAVVLLAAGGLLLLAGRRRRT